MTTKRPTVSIALIEAREHAARNEALVAAREVLAELANIIVEKNLWSFPSMTQAVKAMETLNLTVARNEQERTNEAIAAWVRRAHAGASFTEGVSVRKDVVRDAQGQIMTVYETPIPLDRVSQ